MCEDLSFVLRRKYKIILLDPSCSFTAANGDLNNQMNNKMFVIFLLFYLFKYKEVFMVCIPFWSLVFHFKNIFYFHLILRKPKNPLFLSEIKQRIQPF